MWIISIVGKSCVISALMFAVHNCPRRTIAYVSGVRAFLNQWRRRLAYLDPGVRGIGAQDSTAYTFSDVRSPALLILSFHLGIFDFCFLQRSDLVKRPAAMWISDGAEYSRLPTIY